MARLKSKKYLLAAVFALAAFGATFAAVLAGVIPVQWSREQPATVVGVAVQVLPPDSMTLFRNAGLTQISLTRQTPSNSLFLCSCRL